MLDNEEERQLMNENDFNNGMHDTSTDHQYEDGIEDSPNVAKPSLFRDKIK